ncbi:hypothetical protein [Pseudonocardia endophytica]|uniref:Uncharacterized protein n=1 Tax=Pseudonocardia endophytica TaxID=401976 RepID=A0A4R1I448_PSEEN|nr:hypothetical protein [Pseudonocardia endophytica]TCK24792.1 hypothetical protein EV378_0585 [Pseudonocardia endophytica]
MTTTDRPGDGGTADLAGDPRTGDDERPAGDRQQRMAGDDGDGRTGTDTGATLIEPERARGYQDRWQALKGDFVDEPRRAVKDANGLVGGRYSTTSRPCSAVSANASSAISTTRTRPPRTCAWR